MNHDHDGGVTTVLLDIDGTLIDSNDQHAQSWVDVMRDAGYKVTFEQIRRLIGMGGDNLLPAAIGVEKDSAAGKALSEKRRERFFSHYLDRIQPFPGARDLLVALRGLGYTLVVATSASPDELAPLLDRAQVADLLAEETSSGDANQSKPDPDIIQAALRKAGCGPEQAIMLGDTPYDVEASTRAAVPIVALLCGGWTADHLRGALAVYKDPAELLSFLDSSPFAHDVAMLVSKEAA